MAIIYYKLPVPISVDNTAEISLADIVLFAERLEVPPDRSINITPAGYRDEYYLRTMSRGTDRENTVGEIKVKRMGGKKISAYHGVEGGPRALIETERQTAIFQINESTPLFVLVRPNALDGGRGVRVDGIIRYEPSVRK